MGEILISTDALKALSSKMLDCAEHMSAITTDIHNATELIKDGSFNSSIDNMNNKMSGLNTYADDFQDNLAANYSLLQLIAQAVEEENNKLKNLIPDWAKETFPGHSNYYRAEDGKIGSVSYTNRGGNVSCTYYTLHRLREKGLGFPFKTTGQADGGQWFDTASNSAKKYAGNDCLKDIFNEYCTNGKEVKNIVVSMKSTSSAGHVILIDRMYKNPETGEIMIEWSDMTRVPPFKSIYGDHDQKNETITRTYESFRRDFYDNWAGPFYGAVIIGE